MSESKATDYETLATRNKEDVARFETQDRTALEKLQRFLHSYPTMVPVIVLVASLISFGIIAGGKFFSPLTFSTILQQVSIIGILAAAQSLIILTAGIDLSVGAIMVLMAVIMGKLGVVFGVPTPLAILIGMAGGMAAGILNGAFVTRLKLPPFIVTLGTWYIFLATTWLLSGSQSIRSQDIDDNAPLLKLFGISINFWGTRVTLGSILMITIFLVLWYVLNKTAWGRHVYAVGDDAEAAELAGIRTNRHLISVYAVAGLICGIAAWASVGRIGSISPTSFAEANLESITAVVIGGISLFGGRGSIMGPLFGALIVGVFRSGLGLAGLDVQWQVFAIGWLIILAVTIDQWIRRVAA